MIDIYEEALYVWYDLYVLVWLILQSNTYLEVDVNQEEKDIGDKHIKSHQYDNKLFITKILWLCNIGIVQLNLHRENKLDW